VKRVPRILVFQHMEAGHPGIFRDLLRQDEVAAHTVRLDLGERIPDLGAFDALWVMGGPQDVWEEAEHPWLVEEKAAIREAVLGRAMPFLGICLGHQLLADALGGEVGPAAEPEIGVFEVELGAGAGHPLFAGLPQRSPFLQWHRAEARRPPADAKVLASSPRCAVQAIAVGQCAFGLQCHAEVDAATLDEWLGIPAAVEVLAQALGRGEPAYFAAQARAHMAACNRAARQLYANFMTLLPAGSGRRPSKGQQ
jgi:GMP synthase-like glutamine amidotransferase